MSTLYYASGFAHHGIKGMKWGIRRYQNRDGSLTWEGKQHVEQLTKNDLKFNTKYIPKEHMDAVNKSLNDLKDYLEIAHELHNDEKLLYKYAKMSAEHDLKEYGEPGESTEPSDDMIRDYMYSDLNQGYGSALAFYLKDKGSSYSEYEDGYAERFREYSKTTDEISKDLMQQVGKMDFRSIAASTDRDNVKRYMDIAVSDYFSEELWKKGYYLD